MGKNEGSSRSESVHIIVTEVPPGFLKRRNVRSHFSRFGKVVRLSIRKTYCVITFDNVEEAKKAVRKGGRWKDMPMKIDFKPDHDPFSTDDAIINEELNWFAEEPDYQQKPVPGSSKSRLGKKNVHHRSENIITIDISDDENSKPSQVNRIVWRRSGDGKSLIRTPSEKRQSATSRFLNEVKSDEPKRVKLFDEDKQKRNVTLEEPVQETSMESRIDRKSGEGIYQPSVLQQTKFDIKSPAKQFTLPSQSKEKTIFNEDNDSKTEDSDKLLFANKLPEYSMDVDNNLMKTSSQNDNKTSSTASTSFSFISAFSEGFNNSKQKAFPSDKFGLKTIINKAESKSSGSNEENSDTKTKLDENDGSSISFNSSATKGVGDSKTLLKANEENKQSEESRTLMPRPLDDSKTVVKAIDAPFYLKVANTLQEKLNVLEERDRQMRLKLEKSIKLESAVQGTCPDMCPEKERILRELMNIIASYESLSDGKMDHSKAVKEYARSSADQEEPLPHELRPEPVLTMTMTYLINCIISRIDEVNEENLSLWYDFCWGRLRAIRKDIIQQQLCDRSTVVILEQCARFHIACYDRLWTTDTSKFDDKINTETLVNCLQSLIHMYEDLKSKGISCPNEAEFISYLILLKLNSGFLMSEYQRYSKSLKESVLVKSAVKIHLSYNNNMYSTFFKLVEQTSYLNACLLQRFFQYIRIIALNTTVKAHCIPNKVTNISVNFLMKTLRIDSLEECISFCESVGLVYNEEDKNFKISRGDLTMGSQTYKIETPSSLVVKKRVPIAEAVVGNNHTLPIYLNHTVHSSFNDEGILNENALDASDQEEKMLRDDVERQILLSRLKSTFAHKMSKDINEESKLSKPDETSTRAIPEIFVESIDNVESEEDGLVDESLNVDVRDERDRNQRDDTLPSSSPTPLSSASTKVIPPSSPQQTDPASPPETYHHSPLSSATKLLPSPRPEQSLSTPFKFAEFNTSNNFSSLSTESPSHFSPSYPPFSPSSMITTTKLAENRDRSSKIKRRPKSFQRSVSHGSPISNSSKSTLYSKLPHKFPGQMVPSSSNQSKKHSLELNVSSSQSQSKINDYNKECMEKLRKKMSENMKKIAARKYLKIWKDKVSRMKSSSECEAMALYNIPVNHYMRVWGKHNLKHTFNLPGRLQVRKKSNLMVHMILNTNISENIDKSVSKIGKAMIDVLGEASVRKAEEWGNIAQPNPVFWKLVFALPEAPPDGSTFPIKLRAWCKAAFSSKRMTPEVESHMSESGVAVFTRVTVVEGYDGLDSCSNMTGLIVIRARGWESVEETENRCSRLLSFRSMPIPVAVLNLGSFVDHIGRKSFSDITHFEECLWDNSKTVTRVLCNLAQNVYLLNLKVKPFSSLMEISCEKLFDLIQQDCYLNDRLEDAVCYPQHVIHIYNRFLKQIEEEIVYCKSQNLFGTASEFKRFLDQSLDKCHIFPDNYEDDNFITSFSFRSKQCKLRPFKTQYKDWEDVVNFLKHYCDDTGCLNILNKLVRLLKLPDDDEDKSIDTHLKTVQWLPFIEIILKQIFTSPLLTFRVVYREDVINRILQTHFWLDGVYF